MEDRIRDAAKNTSPINDEALTIQKTDSGYTLQQTKGIKPIKHTTEDEDLKWYQILEARHNLLNAAANWPEDMRLALAIFYINLKARKASGVKDRALVLYHATTRKKWHTAMKKDDELFNISIINLTLLASFIDEVQDEEFKAMQTKVRHLPFPITLVNVANKFVTFTAI